MNPEQKQRLDDIPLDIRLNPAQELTFIRNLRDNPTIAEVAFDKLVEDFNEKHKTRYYRQVKIIGYIVDFYFPEARLAVEIDGDSHIGKEQYDKERQQHLEEYGIKVIRFQNEEVLFANTHLTYRQRNLNNKTKKAWDEICAAKYRIRDTVKEAIYQRAIEWSLE